MAIEKELDESNVPLILRKGTPNLNLELRHTLKRFVRSKVNLDDVDSVSGGSPCGKHATPSKSGTMTQSGTMVQTTMMPATPSKSTGFSAAAGSALAAIRGGRSDATNGDELTMLAHSNDIDYMGKDFYSRDAPFTSILPPEVLYEDDKQQDSKNATPKANQTMTLGQQAPKAGQTLGTLGTPTSGNFTSGSTPNRTMAGTIQGGLLGGDAMLSSTGLGSTDSLRKDTTTSTYGNVNPLMGLPMRNEKKRKVDNYHYSKDSKYIEIKKKVERYFLLRAERDLDEDMIGMEEDDPLFETQNLYIRLRDMLRIIEKPGHDDDNPEKRRKGVERMAAFYRAHMEIFMKPASKKGVTPLYLDREDDIRLTGDTLTRGHSGRAHKLAVPPIMSSTYSGPLSGSHSISSASITPGMSGTMMHGMSGTMRPTSARSTMGRPGSGPGSASSATNRDYHVVGGRPASAEYISTAYSSAHRRGVGQSPRRKDHLERVRPFSAKTSSSRKRPQSGMQSDLQRPMSANATSHRPMSGNKRPISATLESTLSSTRPPSGSFWLSSDVPGSSGASVSRAWAQSSRPESFHSESRPWSGITERSHGAHSRWGGRPQSAKHFSSHFLPESTAVGLSRPTSVGPTSVGGVSRPQSAASTRPQSAQMRSRQMMSLLSRPSSANSLHSLSAFKTKYAIPIVKDEDEIENLFAIKEETASAAESIHRRWLHYRQREIEERDFQLEVKQAVADWSEFRTRVEESVVRRQEVKANPLIYQFDIPTGMEIDEVLEDELEERPQKPYQNANIVYYGSEMNEQNEQSELAGTNGSTGGEKSKDTVYYKGDVNGQQLPKEEKSDGWHQSHQVIDLGLGFNEIVDDEIDASQAGSPTSASLRVPDLLPDGRDSVDVQSGRSLNRDGTTLDVDGRASLSFDDLRGGYSAETTEDPDIDKFKIDGVIEHGFLLDNRKLREENEYYPRLRRLKQAAEAETASEAAGKDAKGKDAKAAPKAQPAKKNSKEPPVPPGPPLKKEWTKWTKFVLENHEQVEEAEKKWAQSKFLPLGGVTDGLVAENGVDADTVGGHGAGCSTKNGPGDIDIRREGLKRLRSELQPFIHQMEETNLDEEAKWEKGLEVTGLDFSPMSIDYARNHDANAARTNQTTVVGKTMTTRTLVKPTAVGKQQRAEKQASKIGGGHQSIVVPDSLYSRKTLKSVSEDLAARDFRSSQLWDDIHGLNYFKNQRSEQYAEFDKCKKKLREHGVRISDETLGCLIRPFDQLKMRDGLKWHTPTLQFNPYMEDPMAKYKSSKKKKKKK